MRNGCIRFAIASSPESEFLMFLCVTHSDPLCKLCACWGVGGYALMVYFQGGFRSRGGSNGPSRPSVRCQGAFYGFFLSLLCEAFDLRNLSWTPPLPPPPVLASASQFCLSIPSFYILAPHLLPCSQPLSQPPGPAQSCGGGY